MIDQSQPAHPMTHAVATAIARRCVEVIENLLRQEEKAEAAREFYLAARAELERLSPGRQQLLPIYGGKR
jgi:hypothetical protein